MSLGELGEMVETMPMAPLFVIAHMILVTLNLRGFPGKEFVKIIILNIVISSNVFYISYFLY